MGRKKKITLCDQSVAAEILTEFMFCRSMQEVFESWQKIYDEFELMDDPFTHTPCSMKEYYENQRQLEIQIMESIYGHHDGLE